MFAIIIYFYIDLSLEQITIKSDYMITTMYFVVVD